MWSTLTNFACALYHLSLAANSRYIYRCITVPVLSVKYTDFHKLDLVTTEYFLAFDACVMA